MYLPKNTVNLPRYKYFAAGLFANALWGFMAIPLRGISEWPSDTVLYFRIFVSLFFIWLFILFFRISALKKDWYKIKALSKKEKNRLSGLMILSSFLILANWFTFIYAINRVSITSAAFAYLVCPLITTLAGYFILRERLTNIKWLSLGIALFSVLLLSNSSLVEVLWSVTIASFYAFYLIVQRVLVDIDKLNFLAVQLVVCSLIVLPLMIFNQNELPVASTFWVNISIISVIFTLIPLFLSMFALNRISSSTMGILIYINPVISFSVAIYFFAESISVLQLIAYSLLVIAIALYNSEIIRQIFSKFANREHV
jgi:chloramphenicol-sensitive protein RarD